MSYLGASDAARLPGTFAAGRRPRGDVQSVPAVDHDDRRTQLGAERPANFMLSHAGQAQWRASVSSASRSTARRVSLYGIRSPETARTRSRSRPTGFAPFLCATPTSCAVSRAHALSSIGYNRSFYLPVGRSFNGRTRGSGPRYRGSNPCLPAIKSFFTTAIYDSSGSNESDVFSTTLSGSSLRGHS